MGIELPDMKQDEHFEVLPEAWPAIDAFLAVQTQWRSSSGALIGLDYNAVRWIFELHNVDNQAELLQDLQVIEAKVMEIVNERRD